MLFNRIVLSTLLVALVWTSSLVESNAQTVLDGLVVKEHTPTQKVVPYPPLREADIMWQKRVWRVIELKEKINQPLYLPLDEINDRKNLFHVIKHGIEDQLITAYSTGPAGQDDEFTEPMTKDQVMAELSKMDTQWVDDLDNPGELVQVVQAIETQSSDIKKYKLKEIWFFDKKRSVLDVRIIGIAPQKEDKTEGGDIRGYKDMFWLYFEECRYLFVNYEVFNLHNDAERMSYDDLFMKRRFSSYIIKEENVFNRLISEYKAGIDAILESERVKNDIFLLEHDLWHF